MVERLGIGAIVTSITQMGMGVFMGDERSPVGWGYTPDIHKNCGWCHRKVAEAV
jgi:hypothetical protein